MLSRCVRRVAKNRQLVRRFGGHANPEQEAAKAAAVALRQQRGMKDKNGPAWDDHSTDAPFLKPRAAGTPREDWELSWYVLMGGSFLVLGIGEFYRPDRGPENWARDEAEERLRMEEAGEDVERLHNYAPGRVERAVQYRENLINKPSAIGEDEDE